MLAVAVSDLAVLAGIVVLVGGAMVLSRRINPHWVAKNGSRFIAVARELDERGAATGVKRDVIGGFNGDGVALRVKGPIRSKRGAFRVVAKSAESTDGNLTYIVRPGPNDPDLAALGLFVPASSSLVALLDDYLVDDV